MDSNLFFMAERKVPQARKGKIMPHFLITDSQNCTFLKQKVTP